MTGTSFRRIAPGAGWVNAATLPRGPHGRPCCRNCATEVPPRRRSFCSAACVHHWRLRTDPGYVREQVQHRDHGRCAQCHTCTETLRREFASVPMRKRRAWLTERGIPWARRFGRWWDADHIQPVAEGGGTCDLDNYQTLCLPCHRRKTAEQAQRRKQARQQLLHPRRSTIIPPQKRGNCTFQRPVSAGTSRNTFPGPPA